jgi:hypothetical protein
MPRCAASSVAGPQCEAEIVHCNWASGSPRERRGRTTGVLLSRCPRSSREPSRCGSGGAGSLLATARSPSLTVTELLVVQSRGTTVAGLRDRQCGPLAVRDTAGLGGYLGRTAILAVGTPARRPGQGLGVATFCDWRKHPSFYESAAATCPRGLPADDALGHGLCTDFQVSGLRI